jgi:glycosyltransferase involved in cell wall biosynthesis
MPAAGGRGDFIVMIANFLPGTTQRAPRIVMVLPAYLPESFGGAEQQTRRLAQALARHGAAVTLLAPRLNRSTPAREREGPVAVRRFHLREPPNLGGRHLDSFLLWCLYVTAWLWRHRHAYDVVHVIHGRLHAFPAAIAGNWFGKPVVVKPGGGGEDHFDLVVVQRKRLLGSFFARGIARNTTAWVATSRQIEADLTRWGVSREGVHAIPNGVEIPKDLAPPTRNGVVHFLSMGRLEPEKAVDQTIRAFAALPADAPARLTILGNGPCLPELQALSRSLAQDERIAFPGAVADVRPYLRDADVYVSTSVREGMSNALLEAMSHGVIPVVSRVSGVADMVEEDVSGLLFTPGDEAALTTRLEEILALPPERRRVMGEVARATAHADFSLDRVAEQHLALYRSVLDDSAAERESPDGSASTSTQRQRFTSLPRIPTPPERIIILTCFGRGGSGLVWRMIGSSPDVIMTTKEWHDGVFGRRRVARKLAVLAFNRFHIESFEPLRRYAFEKTLQILSPTDLADKIDAKTCVIKLMDYHIVFSALIRRSFRETTLVTLTRHPYGQCESLMRSGLSLANACRWYNDVARLMIDHWEGEPIPVRFEDVVTRPRDTGERLFESLGVRWPVGETIRFKVKAYGAQRTGDMDVSRAEVICIAAEDLATYVDSSVLRGERERLTDGQRDAIWSLTADVAARLGYTERGSC